MHCHPKRVFAWGSVFGEHKGVHFGERWGTYPPFDPLLVWAKMLDARDAPVEMEIDEEGAIKVLTALETEDPERLYFRVTEEREVHVEGVVARTELVEAFRGALLKFFRDDFDPAHWRPDGDDEDEREDGFVPLREAMLSDRWLNQGGG